MSNRLLTVFGGTGFLGRRVVSEALAAGWNVRVAARRVKADLFRGSSLSPESCVADIREPAAVSDAVRGASAVVNAVALYAESRGESFEKTHVVAAGHVADAARRVSARLVHLSGIGVDPCSPSAYVRARALGEERVRVAYPRAVILRPSAMFGQGDALLGAMVPMVRRLPVLPLFGDGSSGVQPVHVDDVARAVLAALVRHDEPGGVYELGGPRVFSYRELMEGIARRIGRRRWFLPVPFGIWRLLAVMTSPLPAAPITLDQLELVRRENVVGTNRTFEDLGIGIESLTDVLDFVGPDADGGRARNDR